MRDNYTPLKEEDSASRHQDTAYAKRIVRFVLRAVWHLIVERTKAVLPMTGSFTAHIAQGESEDFCKGLFWHAAMLQMTVLCVEDVERSCRKCERRRSR